MHYIYVFSAQHKHTMGTKWPAEVLFLKSSWTLL